MSTHVDDSNSKQTTVVSAQHANTVEDDNIRPVKKAALHTQLHHTSDTTISPSYVSQLPEEMLLEIFHSCVETIDSDMHVAATQSSNVDSDPTDLMTAPLNISQVCAKWRRLALSSSLLWSTVILKANAISQRHFAAIEVWLNRSKSNPVEILLCLRGSAQLSIDAHRLYQILAIHKERITRMHLHLEFDHLSGTGLDVFNGSALEEFVFSSTRQHAHPVVLAQSPRLKVLKLKFSGTYFDTVCSFEQLLHLELELRHMPENISETLARLPSLVSLVLDFKHWFSSPVGEPLTFFPLAHLRSLTIRSGVTATLCFTLLGNLIASTPSLSSLHINALGPLTPFLWMQLTAILNLHKPLLTKLSIKSDSEVDCLETHAPEGGFLAALLRNTPHLTFLSANCNTSEAFLRAMTPQSLTDLSICPHLEEMHFGRFPHTVTAHCLVNMIVSRINMGEKALKRVQLTPFYYHDVGRRKVIKMCISRGLQLNTSSTKPV